MTCENPARIESAGKIRHGQVFGYNWGHFSTEISTEEVDFSRFDSFFLNSKPRRFFIPALREGLASAPVC